MGHFSLLIIIPKEIFSQGERYTYHYLTQVVESTCDWWTNHTWWTIGGRWDRVFKNPQTLEEFIDLDLEFVSPIHYNSISIREYLQLDKLRDVEILHQTQSTLHELIDDYLVVIDYHAEKLNSI